MTQHIHIQTDNDQNNTSAHQNNAVVNNVVSTNQEVEKPVSINLNTPTPSIQDLENQQAGIINQPLVPKNSNINASSENINNIEDVSSPFKSDNQKVETPEEIKKREDDQEKEDQKPENKFEFIEDGMSATQLFSINRETNNEENIVESQTSKEIDNSKAFDMFPGLADVQNIPKSTPTNPSPETQSIKDMNGVKEIVFNMKSGEVKIIFK